MQIIAAAVSQRSAADKLQQIPTEFWIKMGIGIVVLIATVILLRKLAKMNKVVLGVVVLIAVSFVGFNWIYERNEPAWATPAIDVISGFFPSKGTQLKNRQ